MKVKGARESDEVDKCLGKIYLRRDVREHCTRVIQFPIPLQDKQGMKPRDTNNTDRIPLCALSHNFLRCYGYVAPGYRFYFQTLHTFFTMLAR